jgi:uncharacterized protein with GYD domain
METYIVLLNFTQQGIANVKESPARANAFKQAIEAAGGKQLGWYLTIGRYDIVVILQAPNGKTVSKILLALGSLGNVRTETLRAFTLDEFKEIVAGLG